MDPTQNYLEQIANALPLQLEFYHLGNVKMQPMEYEWFEVCTLAFRVFYTESSATVLIRFEKHLDCSMYSELGNLLVSQIANQLTPFSEDHQRTVTITPPHFLSEERVAQLLSHCSPVKKMYVHFFKSLMIPIEALILPDTTEGMGYA